MRSATLIDLLFGLCLLYKAFLSSFPLSTTWVFLGLIGGRELALRIKQQTSDLCSPTARGAVWPRSSAADLWKAAVGVLVSVGIALSIQPLAQITAG